MFKKIVTLSLFTPLIAIGPVFGSATAVNDAYNQIQVAFTLVVDARQGVTWDDWDQKFGKKSGNKLFNLLQDVESGGSTVSSAHDSFKKLYGGVSASQKWSLWDSNFKSQPGQTRLWDILSSVSSGSASTVYSDQQQQQQTVPRVQLSGSATAVNDVYNQIKAVFTRVVDVKQGVTWADWDQQFGQKSGSMLFNLLQDVESGRSDCSSAYASFKNRYGSIQTPQKWSLWESNFKSTRGQTRLWDILKSLSSGSASTVYSAQQQQQTGPRVQQQVHNYTPTGQIWDGQRGRQKITDLPNAGAEYVIPHFGSWGHMPNNGFDFLSNYHVSEKTGLNYEIVLNVGGRDCVFTSVENAYQCGKTLIAGKKLTLQQISQFQTATQDGSKTLANKTFLYTFQPNHATKLDGLMENLVRQKFINSGSMANELVNETGNAHLVEGNCWNDTRWGMPYDSGTKTLLPGENKLGKMLMKIRDVSREKVRQGQQLAPVAPYRF